MPKLTLQSQINILKKDYLVAQILETLIYLPAEDVKDFFLKLNLTVPRKLRMTALRNVLYNHVQGTKEERKTLADELGYRLTWFELFSEIQLENLLEFYNDAPLRRTYLEQLWLALLDYMTTKRVPQKDLAQLIKNSVDYVNKNRLSLPNTKIYNDVLTEIFFDDSGEIDGLKPEQLRPVLYKSSTLTEIRELGTKYGVDVPKRLKKNELADIIVQELKERKLHTDEEEKKVRAMSVMVLQRYAINNGIKASTELKKEEIIEYILSNAKETREAYYLPSKDVYDIEFADVKIETETIVPVDVVEIVEEQPVVEEEPVTQEIIEEPDVVEDKIEPIVEKVEAVERVVYQKEDQTELIEELRNIRHSIENIKLQVSTTQPQSLALQEVSLDLEPVFIDAVDFKGSKKDWKPVSKALNELEIEKKDQQETPIQKVELVLPEEEENKSDQPAEVRFVAKLLVLILKIVLYLVGLAVFLFIVYVIVTFFFNISFLDSVTDTINRFEISGKGILDIIYDFLESLGLPRAQ